ncbi:MAG: glycoside hydrolase family 9 protein [Sphaerochaetaceae bacterium]|nr:glycoside hydrolase family 9 protein [Sphaerochaetaceae bacterium]
MNILHNHVGFRPEAHKLMIVQTAGDQTQSSDVTADLVSHDDLKIKITLKPIWTGTIKGWKNRVFYQFDFSDFSDCGTYRFHVRDADETTIGAPFRISSHVIDSDMISDVIFYFKGQRSTGRWDETDRSVPFYGSRKDLVDVHGGWFDASGDYSKYLSHLSYTNYLNPQQIPLTVWVLLQLGQTLASFPKHGNTLLVERSFEEAWWGADFLMRMQDREGYFYMTVFDKWNKKSEERMISAFMTQQGIRLENYQAGFRQGGGMAVAALARAARIKRNNIPADGYEPQQFLVAADKGYRHLVHHNLEYLDNGKENIIDCYCALIASVELFRTTSDGWYLDESRRWAIALSTHFDAKIRGWVVEPGGNRPYYHASDSGLVILSLLHYFSIEPNAELRATIAKLIIIALKAELDRANAVMNPFRLSRQIVQDSISKEIRESFFVPHNNESGYWWQGENARISSMTSMFRIVNASINDLYLAIDGDTCKDSLPDYNNLSIQLLSFADAHQDWILGCNPYDMCMLQGHGRNNPRYDVNGPNAPGGICNGITGGYEDELDIDFLPAVLEGRSDHRWRWSEQWIPHATWFVLGLVSAMGNITLE